MNKKLTALALAICLVPALAACKETPKNEFVVKKDTERLIERVQTEEGRAPEEDESVPQKRYTFSTTAAEGRLEINVDANVRIAGAGIPTARVEEGSFTEEQVKGMFNYLFPNGARAMKTGMHIRTKAEIQEEILLYKRYIAEDTVAENTLLTKEELQNEIAELEKQYAAAPDKQEAGEQTASDGSLLLSTSPINGADVPTKLLAVEGEGKQLIIELPEKQGSPLEPHLNFYSTGGEYYDDSEAAEVDELESAETRALADGFFAAAGIEDAVFDSAYSVSNERGETAYKLLYVRAIEGVPAAHVAGVTSQNEYELPWAYEEISFIVSDDGIEKIDWISPTRVTELLNENTSILDFSEISGIFEKMLVTAYETNEAVTSSENARMSITVNEAALSCVRIREQNAEARKGIYIPAWVFYGDVATKNGAGETYLKRTKYPVLAINAVDGSIVDLSKGY